MSPGGYWYPPGAYNNTYTPSRLGNFSMYSVACVPRTALSRNIGSMPRSMGSTATCAGYAYAAGSRLFGMSPSATVAETFDCLVPASNATTASQLSASGLGDAACNTTCFGAVQSGTWPICGLGSNAFVYQTVLSNETYTAPGYGSLGEPQFLVTSHFSLFHSQPSASSLLILNDYAQ